MNQTEVRGGLWYTEEHEWVRIEDDTAVIGITDYAQKEMKEIVFVELPKVGDKLASGEDFGYAESAKAVNGLFAPLSGEVIEVNTELEDSPELVNTDPYSEGWMIKVRMSSQDELSKLLDADSYSGLLETLEE
ncbi:MAG: glycine cleavage system protein GcvH [Methanosarcinales archaeon]|nr:glycine cleavage system protein GcvH [Methanosarcinales archaeon]